MKKFEYAIGKTFRFNGCLYRVAEYRGAEDCCRCALGRDAGCNKVPCTNVERTDKKNVYFEEVAES